MEEKKLAGHPKGIKNKKYSKEFKVEIIEMMHREKLGYRETARIYLPDISDGTAMTYIKKWERIYLEEGPEGLGIERRGLKGGRFPKKPLQPNVEQDLISRIQYLEMENEYLKKLKALVSKRERQEKKKRK